MALRFENLRVGRRLLLVTGVLLGLLVAVLLLGLAGLSSQHATGSTLAEAKTLTRQAMQVKFRSADFNGWQTAYAFDIVRGEPAATADDAEARKAFLASAEDFGTELDQLAALPINDAERAKVVDAKSLFARFMTLDVTVIDAYRSADPAKVKNADKLVAIDEIAIFNQIAADIDALVTSIDAGADRVVADAGTQANRSKTLMLGAGALALLLGAMLARVLTRSITRPLSVLQQGLGRIGDGDLVHRVPAHRRDEIGQVAKGLNQLAERMQHLIGNVATSAQSVAGAATELSAVSEHLAGTAQETSTQAEVVSSSSEEVSTMVSMLAGAAEEMSASIGEIAQNTSRAAQIATDGVAASEAANTTVAELGESTGRIGDVVKLITAIAEQTNLLALNATIEAARAGELGKGFAVVAGEVKELAQQTAVATEDITKRIDAIQTGSSRAATVIRQIGDVVTEISETQTVIAAAVEQQSATAQEMSRNIADTASGANQIAANISGVAASADNTSRGATTTRLTADDLKQSSAQLQQLIDAFRY